MESNLVTLSEKSPQNMPTFTKVIDGKTYLVRIFFAPKGAETLDEKIMREMKNVVTAQLQA